jgi:hypothetical protein
VEGLKRDGEAWAARAREDRDSQDAFYKSQQHTTK